MPSVPIVTMGGNAPVTKRLAALFHERFTVRSSYGAGLAVSVKVAAVPSVIGLVTGATDTAGTSSSRIVNVMLLGEPTENSGYSVFAVSVSVMVPSAFHDAPSASIGVDSVPMPSISMWTVWPGLRNSGGSRAEPTPSGVPVAITSPGWRVMIALA